jgi:hypothetical protein
MEQGRAAYEEERFEEALHHFTEATTANPGDKEAWFEQADALYKLGRYEETLTSFDRVIELDPSLASAWNNRGVVLDDLNRRLDAQRSRMRGLYEALHTRPADQDTAKVISFTLDRLRGTRTAPLLAVALCESYGLLDANVFLRFPAFYWEAWQQSAAYQELRDFFESGQHQVAERDQKVLLGLGAYYLGDVFQAMRHFEELEEQREEDLLVQFYLLRCYYDLLLERDLVQ